MDWYSTGLSAFKGAIQRPTGTAARPAADFTRSAFGAQQNPFAGGSGLGKTNRGQSTNPFASGRATGAKGNPFTATGRGLGYGTNPVSDWDERARQQMAAREGAMGGFGNFGGMGTGGQAMPTGPSFAGGNLDDATGEINAAAAKYGVPANLVKAILAKESTGNWARDGNRTVGLRGQQILPYSGIFRSTADAWGLDFDAMVGNRALQIEGVAKGLQILYGRVGAEYGWEGVASTYFSGKPVPSGWVDELGNSDTQYVNQVIGWWKELDAQAGFSGGYGAPGGGSGSWQAWQGDYSITQEFGPTPFSQGEGAWMYGYGASVGVQGHPGLDVGMPAGTSVVAPVGGTVVIAGGSGYYRDVSGDGPGRGELRIQLDNGDILILGHMRNISVSPGQRINPGQMVGLSGSFNGDHLHYEVRRATPGATSSGYTAVDPRTYFSGNSWQGGGMMGGSVSQPRPANNGMWWMSALGSLFGA